MKKKINTVSIIGLGAIGAAYGSKLFDVLHDSFRVVANGERIQRFQQNGLYINGEKYEFPYITPETKTEPSDLVIFAVKNAELKQAIKDMKHHIGPDTIILSLLNGISSEEEIYEAYQNEHILYSLSVEIDAVRRNNEVNYSTIGRICFGEKEPTISEDVQAVQDLFDQAQIPYEISENMLHTLWWKFMINVGVNQTSAVLRAPYGVFQQIPSAYEFMESVMYEVVALSEKVGVPLSEEDVKKFKPILHKLSPEGRTSMLQDVDAGRKTEVNNFAGKVCELGRVYGVPTPINEQLYKMIRIIEETASLQPVDIK
jgi:2-dehydropantoate 2-reductase